MSFILNKTKTEMLENVIDPLYLVWLNVTIHFKKDKLYIVGSHFNGFSYIEIKKEWFCVYNWSSDVCFEMSILDLRKIMDKGNLNEILKFKFNEKTSKINVNSIKHKSLIHIYKFDIINIGHSHPELTEIKNKHFSDFDIKLTIETEILKEIFFDLKYFDKILNIKSNDSFVELYAIPEVKINEEENDEDNDKDSDLMTIESKAKICIPKIKCDFVKEDVDISFRLKLTYLYSLIEKLHIVSPNIDVYVYCEKKMLRLNLDSGDGIECSYFIF